MILVRPCAIALLFLSVLNGYSIKAMTKFQEKRDPNLKIKMSFAFLIIYQSSTNVAITIEKWEQSSRRTNPTSS
eukprot:10713.XXX_4587_4808_1 [CDS] Oithona nana genome sequencing.